MKKKPSSILVAPVAASGTGELRPGLDLVGEIAATLAPFIATYGSHRSPHAHQEGGESPCP